MQYLIFLSPVYIEREDIQIFGMNMTFVSLSEAENLQFMSGKDRNEIYNFFASQDKKMSYSFQKFEFPFDYIQF